jgi:hypothetical protein
MAESLKNLGQLAPTATTLSDLYTVPASTSASISSIIVCNTGTTTTTFRISVAVGGAIDSIKQYIFYDQSLDGNSTFTATIGVTVTATDKIRVYAGNSDLSFNVFGIEVS